jgi:hypothetical protein
MVGLRRKILAQSPQAEQVQQLLLQQEVLAEIQFMADY